MGAFVLGIDTVALCPHGGKATIVPSQTRVTLNGVPVAVQTDVTTVAGCAFVVGPSPAPCTVAQWTAAATRVTLNGVPALLNSSVGMVTATVPGPINIVSQQTRVTGT